MRGFQLGEFCNCFFGYVMTLILRVVGSLDWRKETGVKKPQNLINLYFGRGPIKSFFSNKYLGESLAPSHSVNVSLHFLWPDSDWLGKGVSSVCSRSDGLDEC